MRRCLMVMVMLVLCQSAHAYSVKSKSFSEKNPATRLEISASYPVLKGLKDGAVETALNQGFLQWVQGKIARYKSDVAERQADQTMDQIPGTNMLNISYAVKLKDDTRLVISWDVNSYLVGAAHPNEVLTLQTYDLVTGKVITLADIFKPGTPYLKRLSQICRERLTASLANSGFELFEDGLKPVPENFANFLMRPEGLYFVFNPYQVAPYVAGVQEVVVPYAQIRDLMTSK